MKSMVAYYMAILLPGPLLVWLLKSGQNDWFAVMLLVFALPYRMVPDGLRLSEKRLLTRKEL